MAQDRPVHLAYSFPGALGRAGVGTTAYHQVVGAAREGADVTVFCTRLDRPLPLDIRVVETMRLLGVRVPRRSIGVDRSRRFHDFIVARALTKATDSFNVLHCWPSASVLTLQVAKELEIPSFREVPNTHTAHAYRVVADETAQLGVQADPSLAHTPKPRVLERELLEYGLAKFVLVPSVYSARTFVENGVSADKLVRHHYGYDSDRIVRRNPADADLEGGRSLKAVFVGKCEPRKGLHFALEAWHESGIGGEGAELSVCGDFSAGYREHLAYYLADESVRTLGFVEDVPGILSDADVLILPSVEEGSALVTYEAQAAGCALLVSTATGARCEHGKQGLIHEPGDVRTIATHLRDLQGDLDLRARLKRAAAANAETLSWTHAAKITMSHYSSAIAGLTPPDALDPNSPDDDSWV